MRARYQPTVIRVQTFIVVHLKSLQFQMSESRDGTGRGRGTKRKLEEKTPGGKKSKGELSTPPLPSTGYPKEHPFNRDGYRYVLAEPDPHAPFRSELNMEDRTRSFS